MCSKHCQTFCVISMTSGQTFCVAPLLCSAHWNYCTTSPQRSHICCLVAKTFSLCSPSNKERKNVYLEVLLQKSKPKIKFCLQHIKAKRSATTKRRTPPWCQNGFHQHSADQSSCAAMNRSTHPPRCVSGRTHSVSPFSVRHCWQTPPSGDHRLSPVQFSWGAAVVAPGQLASNLTAFKTGDTSFATETAAKSITGSTVTFFPRVSTC